MRFSVAASAVLFGAAVMAVPNSVVYETQYATITSCAPEKTDCPGKATSIPVAPPPAPPVYTVPSVSVPIGTGVPPAPPVGTGAPPAPPAACPGAPYCPPAGSPAPPVSPAAPTYAPPPYPSYVPSASTGVVAPPANTSTPVAPTTAPPVYEGAASVKGFSLIAVVAAAGAVFLA